MRVRKLMISGTLLLIFVFISLLWIAGAKAKENSYESFYTSFGVQRVSPPVKATDFTLENLEGVKLSPKDFKGKIVLLNFWASWCGPCQREMPSMEKLWNKFKEGDFIILAVDIQEGKDEVKSFIKEKGYTFPVLLDSKGKVAKAYKIRAIPTTFIIDQEENIVGKVLGARDWANQDAFKLMEYLISKRG